MHAHAIPCHGCNGHTVCVIKAGATECVKLHGNAYIRLNIAVLWDKMLCHCLNLFLMLLRTIASETAGTTAQCCWVYGNFTYLVLWLF
jgi:hypothetical protein